MTDIGTVTAHIGLDTKDLEKGHARSRAILGQLGSQTGDASARFGGLGLAVGKAGAALAAIGAGTAVLKFLKDSVTAGMESQTAWNDLTAAIIRHGGSWSVVGAQIETFASGIQRSFGLSDEAVAQSIQRFVDYGMSTTTAMQMTRSAIDLSVGAHVDLESAVKAIARGYAGNTGLLQRLTGVTEEAATGTEKFSVTMERLQKMFGGAAQAQFGSYTLKVRTLKESFSEASEAFGKLLLKSGEAAGLATVLDRLASGAFNIAQKLDALGTASGRIAELRANLAALDTVSARGGTTVGFGTEINDAVRIFAAQLAVSVKDVGGLRKKMQQELDMLLAMQRLGKLATGGWQGTPFSLPEDTTNLKENLLRGIGTTGGMTSNAELELMKQDAEKTKQANEDLKRLADERWQIKRDLLEGIGTAGEMTTDDTYLSKLRAEQQALEAILQSEKLTAEQRKYYASEYGRVSGQVVGREALQMGDAGLSSGVIAQMNATKMNAVNKAVKELGDRSPETQKAYEALTNAMADSTQRAVDSIIDGFLRGRVALGDIFRGMAEDFISMFLRQIMMKIGAKLAGALLGFVLGGPVGAAGGSALGDWATGGGDILAKPVVEPSYLGRLAPAQPQSSVLVITPPMSVSQDYIRKVVAPELRRLALNGASY